MAGALFSLKTTMEGAPSKITDRNDVKFSTHQLKRTPMADVAQKAAKELDDAVRNISLSDALDGIDILGSEPAVAEATDANSTTFELPHL